MTATSEDIRAAADRIAAAGDSTPRLARDPVNLPMIRSWLEAVGGPGGPPDPETAPPAMIQVWTMPGLHGTRGDDDPLGAMIAVLDEAGYTGVVATNCDQVYHRYLKIGEQVAVSARLTDLTGPKRTALGEGWFITIRNTWTSDGEQVASMDWRILKYAVASAPPRPPNQGATRPRYPRGQPCALPSRRTPSSSGQAPRPANCASSGARTAGRCATRPARCARPAAP